MGRLGQKKVQYVRASRLAALGSSLKQKVGSSLFGHNTSPPHIWARLHDAEQTTTNKVIQNDADACPGLLRRTGGVEEARTEVYIPQRQMWKVQNSETSINDFSYNRMMRHVLVTRRWRQTPTLFSMAADFPLKPGIKM